MRWIRRLVILALVLVALPGVALWIHGPLGPLLAGPLFGDVVTERVEDWSFTDAHAEIQVQTHVGFLPYSVTTWCLSHERELYVPARNGGDKRWVRQILADPDAWIRVKGEVYPVRFRRVTALENGSLMSRLILGKYIGVEADEVRPVSDGPGSGEPPAEIWLFHVTSRDAG